MADHEPYVILDIKGLIQHAYHAGNDPEALNEATGESVNTAGFGFATFLDMYPLFENIPPRRIIAVWDGGNDYRRNLFSGYKAKRKARAEKERKESPIQAEETEKLYDGVKRFLMALGATQVKVPGVEADDVIKMLCDALISNTVGIYTVDADLYQLADDRIEVAIKRHMDKGEGPAVEPGLIALQKSILGDTTDEYPGVVGIGDKGWEAMVSDFGIDGMYELKEIISKRNYPKMKEVASALPEHKQVQMLLEQFEHWGTMYQLAILHPELCYTVKSGKIIKPQWARRVPEKDRLMAALGSVGMGHLYAKFEHWLPTEIIAPAMNESPVLAQFMQDIKGNPLCAFDYESYDPLNHEPFQDAKAAGSNFVDVLSQSTTGVSFCYGSNFNRLMYMPCGHVETEEVHNWPKEHIAWAVRYAQAGSKLIAHNASFEMALSIVDLQVPALASPYDTMVMASHVDEDESTGLKALSMKWLNFTQQTYKELLDAHGVDDMSQLTAEQTLSYGCDDSLVTAHLFDLFWLMTKCEGTWDFIRDNEFDFVQEQTRAFWAGVNFDMDTVKRLEAEAEKAYAENREKLSAALTENCKNPYQVGANSLFQDMWKFQYAKLTAAEATPEEIEEKKKTLWERCYFGSRYVPAQTITETKKVELTPKRTLQPVAEALGFDRCPPIEKVTKKFFTEEWFPIAEEMASEDEGSDPNEDKQTFINLIREVINEKAWKNKESEEYIRLAEFCAAFLHDSLTTTQVIGDELNFDSPDQMQEMLYAKMGLPIRVRSKVDHGSTRDKLGVEGSPATNAKAVARALAEDIKQDDWRFEALNAYLAAKTAATQLKLFLRPLPLWKHPKDGMVHPQFKNCGTVTRRPTGTAPNMLQLTKKDGGRLRSSVRPRLKDHVIVSADFAGQELRITASESEDPLMLDAYIGKEKKDIHSVTSAVISPTFLQQQVFVDKYGIGDLLNVKTVDYETFMGWRRTAGGLDAAANQIRKSAKAVNFLIAYLGGYTTLAENLMIPSDLAKEIMNSTFERYARLRPWQDETIEFAKTHGYTETAYGSRRHADSRLFSNDDSLRTRMERQVVNATIQGCAADILKEVMATCHRERVFTGNDAFLIAPVYDELVASVPRETVVDFSFALKQAMEVTPPGHKVPMVAEFSYGAENWGELVEVGADITPDNILAALEKEKAA